MDYQKDEIRLEETPTSSGSASAPKTQVTLLSDDQHLMRLGKKPLLKRSFGFMSLLGFSCAVLISWEGILAVSISGLLNGGPAGVFWGFLIVFVGTLSTFATIGELASMAPVAGGQYHWVAMLGPKSSRNFLSYLTGWVTVLGWQSVAASSGYLLSTLTQGIAVLTHPEYEPKAWHTVLIFWAIMSFAVLVNSTTGKFLARFEGAVLILHLLGFFAVLIPMVYLGPHASASEVFSTWINSGGWSSDGLSFLVGMPSAVFCMMGADSAVHMSEEIIGAATVVPQALIYSVAINGTLAWAMVIAMIFCMGNIDDALNAAGTMFYPFIEIFWQAVNSRLGAAFMSSIILVMGIASAIGVYAASSRMLWSFARDKGVPGWSFLVKLTPGASLPVYAILVTLFISMMLSLIPLGSSVAFNNIISLSVAGLYSSYLLATGLLLWRRLTGKVAPYSDTAMVVGPDNLSWGPWKIPEPFSTINNFFCVIYLVFIWFWSFWPPATPATAETMNFSVLVFGAVVIFCVIWWFVRAKRHFKGPLQELDLSH